MVYLPDNCFKNILDFCGDTELVEMRGKTDKRLEDEFFATSENAKKWLAMDGQTASVHRDLVAHRPPPKPGKFVLGKSYEWSQFFKWACSQDEYRLYKEIDQAHPKTPFILKWFKKHDGTIYTKYFLDDTCGTCCKDCGKFKPNTYVRCIDCYAINQEYWNNKPRKFPKGKCLIKL
jgi:hypothetical protein